MSNTGIFAAILALVAGANMADKWGNGKTLPTDKKWLEPVITPELAFRTGVGEPEGLKIPETKPRGAVLIDVMPPPAPAPAAPAAPIRNASTGWRWFTPGGVIESRPKTSEEEQNSLECPQVPGIWDMKRNDPGQWKYCSNPECASNKPELDMSTGNYLPATPAVLQQEVDNAGNVSYYCPVCRNRS